MPPNEPSPSGQQILIIEDNFICQQVYIASLKNYHLSLATTAKEALKHLNRQPFHCILLDIGLPDISGEELLPLIRNHPLNKNTPIIVISSHINKAIRLKCLQLGANHIYAKPISPTRLRQLVENTLGS